MIRSAFLGAEWDWECRSGRGIAILFTRLLWTKKQMMLRQDKRPVTIRQLIGGGLGFWVLAQTPRKRPRPPGHSKAAWGQVCVCMDGACVRVTHPSDREMEPAHPPPPPPHPVNLAMAMGQSSSRAEEELKTGSDWRWREEPLPQ